MASFRDISGLRFGKLTAIEPTGEVRNGRAMWRCACDCGNETVAASKDLKSGNTKSCGCLKRAYEDLSGMRFGRLVAKERAGKDSGGYWTWRCDCDCGNTAVVRAVSLKDGNTRSCGCLARDAERHPSDAVEGTKLGNLTGAPTRQNASGIRGVSYNRRKGRWEAYIKFRGEQRHLGMHRTIEEAAEARREAEQELFDPVLEAHGMEPTSEALYDEALRKAVENDEEGL